MIECVSLPVRRHGHECALHNSMRRVEDAVHCPYCESKCKACTFLSPNLKLEGLLRRVLDILQVIYSILSYCMREDAARVEQVVHPR